MSSCEEEPNEEAQGQGQDSSKKRRIQRACDICRRKKIRCDGSQMPQNRCSNCIAYNFDCTYVEAAKKRGPPKGYVESLENRLENMEKLLQRLCPDADFSQELGANIDRDSWQEKQTNEKPGGSSRAQSSRAQSPSRRSGNFSAAANSSILPVDPDDLPSDDEVGHATLAEGLKRLALHTVDRRFHGKSSGVMLVQAALNLKREFTGYDAPNKLFVPAHRREQFWSQLPWEMISEEQVMHYHYPSDDLMFHLVDNFFTYLNPYLPILHRPSFDRALRERSHHTDIGFGSVVLLVCALGARWSDDPRVFIDNTSSHSAGWKYFDQVHTLRRSLLAPPRLYDLQIYALSSIFLYGSSSPQASWTMTGIGIRLAQDVGAHRKRVYRAPNSIESELWKRVFWVLVALDRFGSAALGRPCAIQDEDFDLDLPLEVDDEYWEHPDPSQCFKQPPNRPASVQYFNSLLKLTQIQAFALRTIYSINKSKILLGFVGPQWEQHIVAELDSALNKWIDTVPEHLRWDPHRENLLHFSQSATLFATYYHLQILIHRPFIPSPRRPSPLTFPSLAICTNAARSCSHVADIQRRRGCQPLPHLQVAVFTAGVVMLLNIWGAKKSGLNVEPAKQMEDVQKCMQVLATVEDKWYSAGKLWDILHELTYVGDLPESAPSNKRERDSDSPISGASPSIEAPPSTHPPFSRPIAGRKGLGVNQENSNLIGPTSANAPSAGMVMPYGSGQQLPPISAAVGTSWYPSSGSHVSSQAPQSMHPPLVLQPDLSQQAGPSDLVPPASYNSTNLNMFEFFEPNTSMMNIPQLPSQSYDMSIQQQQPQHGQNQGDIVAQRNAFPLPDLGQPLADSFFAQPGEGNMVSNNAEALQMWSNAPPTFDLEDWGAYLHNVTGTSRPCADVPETVQPKH